MFLKFLKIVPTISIACISSTTFLSMPIVNWQPEMNDDVYWNFTPTRFYTNNVPSSTSASTPYIIFGDTVHKHISIGLTSMPIKFKLAKKDDSTKLFLKDWYLKTKENSSYTKTLKEAFPDGFINRDTLASNISSYNIGNGSTEKDGTSFTINYVPTYGYSHTFNMNSNPPFKEYSSIFSYQKTSVVVGEGHCNSYDCSQELWGYKLCNSPVYNLLSSEILNEYNYEHWTFSKWYTQQGTNGNWSICCNLFFLDPTKVKVKMNITTYEDQEKITLSMSHGYGADYPWSEYLSSFIIQNDYYPNNLTWTGSDSSMNCLFRYQLGGVGKINWWEDNNGWNGNGGTYTYYPNFNNTSPLVITNDILNPLVE